MYDQSDRTAAIFQARLPHPQEKELRAYGEYRTRRLVLEAWEKLNSTRSR
ncbi:MAG: hypothetical protein NZ739_12005 [Verrucomicrobiae bacterium]|nr:hypothetical protein [Verrucomicrobiae bacterium]MCX7721620.1 hypothetical protein [Verrucomicrobiae bacterium]